MLNTTSSGEHMFSVSGVVVSSLNARMERGKIGQWEYQKQEEVVAQVAADATASPASAVDAGKGQQQVKGGKEQQPAGQGQQGKGEQRRDGGSEEDEEDGER